MSELQDATDIFEMQRGDKMYPGERLIVNAARQWEQEQDKIRALVAALVKRQQ